MRRGVLQLGAGGLLRLSVGRASGDEIGVSILEVLRQLLDDGGAADRVEARALEPPPDLVSPVRHHAPLLRLDRAGFMRAPGG
jgi:hypothetical protein